MLPTTRTRHRGLAVALLLLWSATNAAADAKSLRPVLADVGLDKKAHLAVSYGASLSLTLILRRFDVPRWMAITLASAATLAAASIKELVVDDKYSWGDQAANVAGTAVSAGFVLTLEL